MSAIDKVHITLEHDIDEQYQYQPGEIVRGTICIKLKRQADIRKVFISIFGQGSVSWEDEKTGEIHQASEIYIDSSMTIVDRALSLHAGDQSFPFEYELPENLPSSFIGKYGSVTYILKATVQGVRSNDTGITSEPFLILRKCPLPDVIETPISLHKSKRVFEPCVFGKISVTAGVDTHGGIPGEDIFINAEVKNRSLKNIHCIQAAIVMVSRYHADKKTISYNQIVNRKRDETFMGKNEGRRWLHSRLTVPPYIPETTLEHCDIIEIFYKFQFIVEISGSADIVLESPLLIGAHPAGLELPKSNLNNRMINSQWTVRDKSLGMDLLPVLTQRNEEELNEWHGGIIPELRSDSAISNPLFRQGSFMNNNSHYLDEMKHNKHRQYDDRVEVMESTKL